MSQTEDQQFTEIATQFVSNIYEETGEDYSDRLPLFEDLLPLENGKLKKIIFAGIKFDRISNRLFKGLDISRVEYIDFSGSKATVIEEGTFDGFDSLQEVKFDRIRKEEIHLPDWFRDRIKIHDLFLKSDDEIAKGYAQQFLQNYRREFGIDYPGHMNLISARLFETGFTVRWGELTRISLPSRPIPKLSARLFEGIDVSKVSLLKFKRAGIEEIEDGTFDDFTSLHRIDLSENELTTLPRIRDEVISGLYQINVSFNRIKSPMSIATAIRNMTPNIELFFEGKTNGQIYYSYGPGPDDRYFNEYNYREFFRIKD